jgi:hypothetical protein
MSAENIKEVVREKYGQAALRVKAGVAPAAAGHRRPMVAAIP